MSSLSDGGKSTGRQTLGSAVPVVLLNDTCVDDHHGCSRVMSTLEYLLIRIGCRVIAAAPAHINWRTDEKILRALDQARMVIVNGEGTIHHNRPEGCWLLEAGEFAKSRGVPAILLNCTWHANGPPFVEKLGNFARVAVRDSWSLRDIRQSGINCMMVPDLSLYQEYNGRSSRKGVGFTDSADRHMSLKLDIARQRCNGQHVPIQFSRNGLKHSYRFFRNYFGKWDLAHPLFLTGMFRLRASHFRRQIHSDESFLNLLAALELLISGRYHACTMALLTGTPFVAAKTNTHKIAALIEDAGLSSWRSSMGISTDSVHEAKRIGWEQHELPAVTDYLADARRRTDELFDDIRRLL